MPEQLPNPYLFVSYTSSERERALVVADALEGAGVCVWIDRQAIAGGASWSAAIVRGIKHWAVFVALGSAQAYASANVQRELNLAVEENKPLLPLLLERGAAPDEVRYALAGRQWVELLDRPEAAWLPEVLRAFAGLGVAPNASQRAPDPNPGNLPRSRALLRAVGRAAVRPYAPKAANRRPTWIRSRRRLAAVVPPKLGDRGRSQPAVLPAPSRNQSPTSPYRSPASSAGNRNWPTSPRSSGARACWRSPVRAARARRASPSSRPDKSRRPIPLVPGSWTSRVSAT